MTDPHEAADAIRGIHLLWGIEERPPSKRGPKPRLDHGDILRAAIDLADAEGVAGVSMQRLAERLDVAVSSLYTYLPGKSTLLAMMLDHAVGWTSLPHTLPGDWRARLEAGAREDWEIYRRHPWVIEIAAISPDLPGPNMMAWLDSALFCLEETGLDEAGRMNVINSLECFVRGTAREARTMAINENGAKSAVRDAFVGEQLEAGRFPHMTRVLLSAPDSVASIDFEFGLARLLDGIAHHITITTNPPAPHAP